MSLAIVHSRAQDGVAAPPVTVVVHLSGGLPGTSIVGLPATPEALELDMPLQVRFEPRDDVSLPVFGPEED